MYKGAEAEDNPQLGKPLANPEGGYKIITLGSCRSVQRFGASLASLENIYLHVELRFSTLVHGSPQSCELEPGEAVKLFGQQQAESEAAIFRFLKWNQYYTEGFAKGVSSDDSPMNGEMSVVYSTEVVDYQRRDKSVSDHLLLIKKAKTLCMLEFLSLFRSLKSHPSIKLATHIRDHPSSPRHQSAFTLITIVGVEQITDLNFFLPVILLSSFLSFISPSLLKSILSNGPQNNRKKIHVLMNKLPLPLVIFTAIFLSTKNSVTLFCIPKSNNKYYRINHSLKTQLIFDSSNKQPCRNMTLIIGNLSHWANSRNLILISYTDKDGHSKIKLCLQMKLSISFSVKLTLIYIEPIMYISQKSHLQTPESILLSLEPKSFSDKLKCITQQQKDKGKDSRDNT
ncbi:hypothetical protein VP01_3679g1 [Puccinia sorghi]|uniref:Uncharacterized protein n=1 Tax=Puccinia sorghi TaxID=27349 RepID=A0A0L6UWA2_9BASI|nr:hypothetical protein VP01_3679g1 [Puccinia sorghi]